MSLQEWPGWLKYKPLVAEKEISFDLDGSINLHTTVKTLKKGKKAICKLEHDCLHLSSGKGFKRSPQLKIYTTLIALQNPVFFLATFKVERSRTVSPLTCCTMFSFVSWMTLAAFICLFSPARNIHAGGLIRKTERWTFLLHVCHRSLFRVNKTCFLVISIQRLNVRFQKGNLTLPLHSCQHLEHAIQVKKKPFGSQVVAKQVELQKKNDDS